MIEFWLHEPVWIMLLILALALASAAGLIHALTFAPWLRSRVITLNGVAPPCVNTLATLLALLTGFVANETWDRQRQAERIVQSESDSVLATYDLTIAAEPDMTVIRTALHSYVTAVIQDEWPKMQTASSSRRAAAALGTLLQQTAKPKIGIEAGAPTQAALLGSVLRIRQVRGERLSFNQHTTDDSKWFVLLILGVLTQSAIGVVHVDRPRAQIIALLIFTTGLVSTLGVIAAHEWPFEGPLRITPQLLTEVADRISQGISAPANQ